MRTVDAEDALKRYLAARDVGIDNVDVMTAASVLIDWYESERVEDIVDESGDMLLFQWGALDWGRGPLFGFDLTRQSF